MAQNPKLTDKKLRNYILKVFENEAGKPLNYKEVAGRLMISKEKERNKIIRILTELHSEGLLEMPDRGKYLLQPPFSMAEGIISFGKNGDGYVSVEGVDQDILVEERHLSTSLPGDTVSLEVLKLKRGGRLKGKVISVVHRSREQFMGTIRIRPNFAFFVPNDENILVDFEIPLSQTENLKDGQSVIVKLISWQEGQKQPLGEIIEALSHLNESDTSMKSIALEFGFPLSFPKEVMQEAEKISLKIPNSELKKRRDFRTITTFTIDPIDAKDFDDAISFQKITNGNYEIGVHIADVSHYVQPGSFLDREAYNRATSVYMVDRVIPMLPEHLSNGVCSLRPNEDKLVFSAVFEINPQAKIVSEWFGKGIIHSNRRFTYEEAQEIIESKTGDFSEEINILNEIAHKLRKAKFANGAISFEKPEVKFLLDPKGNIEGVTYKNRKDAHLLIEDFMLLANKQVARWVSDFRDGKYRDRFVYRIHDAPDPDKLKHLREFVEIFGYSLNIKSRKNIAESINALTEAVKGKTEQGIIEQMSIRSMAKAIYDTGNIGHYGLAFTHYSHFTSPIRRYPDVMVHRLLYAYLEENLTQLPPIEDLKKACRKSTEREMAAAKAERASTKYKQLEMLTERIGEEFEGVISGIKDFGFYVEIGFNLAEGLVRLADVRDDRYLLEKNGFQLVGRRWGNTITMGDKVKVRIKKIDLKKRQMDFSWVEQIQD
jgi:ribonuclease R